MEPIWIVLIVIGALLLLTGIFIIATKNALVRLRNDVEESFSAMDVGMKKRYDLVPNLVNTVKGIMKHESETLTKVIEARNSALGAKTPENKGKAEGELSGALKTLFSLTESYPDLKANVNFLDLQTQLQNVELEISNYRRYFNASVKAYNNKIETFPSSVVAKMFKFERKNMFTVDNVEERKNVKVEF